MIETWPTIWLCSIDGYHPNNSRRWCGGGCGSDYNRMVEVTGLPALIIAELYTELRQLGDAVEKALAHDGPLQEYNEVLRGAVKPARQKTWPNH